MDYARRQRDPTRHLVGIAFVILVHGLVIYALVTGLARKAGRRQQGRQVPELARKVLVDEKNPH